MMEDKIVVIHQPDFMPYLGFFQRLLIANIYVVLDNVQFVNGSKNAWMSRDKIKTRNGESWFTVRIQKSPLETKINEVYLSKDGIWKQKHMNLFSENYKNAKFYNEIIPHIEKLYDTDFDKMMDFNLKSIEMLIKLFDIKIDIVIASDLNATGKNNDLVIDILKKLNCNRYLSGVGAKNYFIPEKYNEAGIEVIWQEFEHPIYEQQFGDFIPYLSSVDLLFNCGIEHSRKILRSSV